MVTDCELRDVALSGTNIVYAADADGNAITAREDLVATCVMKVSTIKDAIETYKWLDSRDEFEVNIL